MSDEKTFSRRSIVKYTSIAASVGLIAGCGGPGGEEEGEPAGNGNGAGGNGAGDNETGNGMDDNETGNGMGDNETETGDNETDVGDNETETGDNETDVGDNETAGNETAGNETAGGDVNVEEWQDVEEIELSGITEGWEGVTPSPIEGETNPTLVLFEGQQYSVTWRNEDGAPHNIAMLDDNEEVVEDYETENISEEGETQTLEFEATSEIAEYYCEVHPDTMRGEVQVESDGGNGGMGNETDGNETDGNETDA